MRRPCFRIPIEPRRLHARLRRADHIELGVIADVQYLRGLDAGFVEQSIEDTRIGLRGAG